MPQAAIRPARFNADEFLKVEELPPPKKLQPKEPEPEKPKPAVIRQVGIADQIAIRSYVLGKTGKSSKLATSNKLTTHILKHNYNFQANEIEEPKKLWLTSGPFHINLDEAYLVKVVEEPKYLFLQVVKVLKIREFYTCVK